jgi:hypothetical protein
VFTVPHSEVYIPTPKIGQVVTFSYETMARRDVPTNPKIYRVRDDVDWNDLVHNFYKEKKVLNGTSSYSLFFFFPPRISLSIIIERSHVTAFAIKEKGYWTPENMRAYLEDFAKSRNMDPLLPETWQNSLNALAQSRVCPFYFILFYLLLNILIRVVEPS